MSARRAIAIFKRHMYVTLHSGHRVFEVFFWPLMDLMLWGFLTVFLQRQGASVGAPVGFLIGGFLVWDVLFRSQVGIAVAFLEETWSRNVIGILASPVTPGEYLAGATAWALAKLAIGWSIMATFAWLFFRFGVFRLGAGLAVLLGTAMLFGLALALVVLGLVLRFGQGTEVLAWGMAVVIMPLSAVFYPVRVLPGWAQALASVLPPSHVFEAMRAVLGGASFPWRSLTAALTLDVVYVAAAFAFARAMYGTLRRRGYVTRYA